VKKTISTLSLLLFTSVNQLFAQRFPEPDFESGYVIPETQTIAPRSLWIEYLDVFVLIVLLSIMTWFVIKKRSRRGIFWTSIISILYFGFYKVGCVCSVGSVQNVTLALFKADYIIPLSVIAFFVIPLVFTLFYGRTFCAGVCFMGAVQDLFSFKPIQVPERLDRALRIVPYIYLAFTILFAATGSDFIICRFDPFIGFFRLSASLGMIIFGVIIILTGIFIARPYCRYLCPYGVILSWMSKISYRHTTITPTQCIQCHLCDTSCPVAAIEKPTVAKAEPGSKGPKRLLILFILLPVFIGLSGFLTSRLYKPLSTVHPTVELAEEINFEIQTQQRTGSEESDAFHTSGMPIKQLFADAADIQSEFHKGTWFAGSFLGLVFGLGLIKRSKMNQQEDYVPDKSNCVSCGKCWKFCPVDHTGNVKDEFKDKIEIQNLNL
jgi:NosR/NirI family nitrous oxide reductase transcriptional regulator